MGRLGKTRDCTRDGNAGLGVRLHGGIQARAEATQHRGTGAAAARTSKNAFKLPAVFPWSRKVHQADHCVLNMVPCDNEFELAFSKFLDDAEDVKSFSKLPQPFGFSIDYTDAGMNLRSYYPDFVAVDIDGAHWLIETKGAETAEVVHKDLAARNWCTNATELAGTPWRYLKIPQKAFEALQPSKLDQLLQALAPTPSSPSDLRFRI